MAEPDINAKVKVLFLYQISKYVMWPVEPSQNGFTIGLYGEYPELLSELNKLAAEKKRGDTTLCYYPVQAAIRDKVLPCTVPYTRK